jgi:hypothetical protein
VIEQTIFSSSFFYPFTLHHQKSLQKERKRKKKIEKTVSQEYEFSSSLSLLFLLNSSEFFCNLFNSNSIFLSSVEKQASGGIQLQVFWTSCWTSSLQSLTSHTSWYYEKC